MFKKLFFSSLVLFAGINAQAQSTQQPGDSDMPVPNDVQQAITPIYGPAASAKAAFSVAPNPFTSQLTLQVPERAIGATWIMETENGTLVYTGVFSGTTTVISTGELSAGTYFFRIEGHLGMPYRVDKVN